jgi:hypothetical protein
MVRTTRLLTVALAVAGLLFVAGAAKAQYVVSTTYYPPPVVSYYSPPVVSYYAPPPAVSYYYGAPAASYYTPTVTYYAPTVTYYPATAVTTTRYGLFGRPRYTTTYWR